jgi:site-specific recombinase XerD
MAAPQSRYRQPKQLDAGDLQPEISSFGLYLAAEGKAARTIRTYMEAVAWFAAHLLREAGRTGWEQVGKHDVQQWMVRLLDRYSVAYASNQFRALQQFFKWLAAEEKIGDPMAGLRPPHVPGRPVPVFAGGDLPRLERACAGRSFQQRRDAAMIATFAATGIRLSELAGLRYDPADPQRSDIDLWHREITVHGKGRTTRMVKISYDAARALDRYIRARARHAQAYRPQLWLGLNNRGPMTASGIYQVISRRAGLNEKAWRGMLVAGKVVSMTEPVCGQGRFVPGDEVARRLGLRAREACYGRRGLRGSVSGPLGRRGPDRQGGALVPREQRSPELAGQG